MDRFYFLEDGPRCICIVFIVKWLYAYCYSVGCLMMTSSSCSSKLLNPPVFFLFFFLFRIYEVIELLFLLLNKQNRRQWLGNKIQFHSVVFIAGCALFCLLVLSFFLMKFSLKGHHALVSHNDNIMLLIFFLLIRCLLVIFYSKRWFSLFKFCVIKLWQSTHT